MGKLAVVTDFDGTLMEQDVGNVIMKELGVIHTPQVIEAEARFRQKEIGSLKWIEAAYPQLEGKQKEVDEILNRVHLRDGAADFISFCKERDIPITILSDGMSYYIQQLLKKHRVEVERVIGNPITFLDDNQFQFGVQNSNPACKWCGCCKAGIVRQMKADGWKIIYIGDGSSDYYGSSFADWIFARSSLARYLTEEGTEFYPFQSFHDILEVLSPAIQDFRLGTAPKRLETRVPAACSFPAIS